jgi:hypothetical protein
VITRRALAVVPLLGLALACGSEPTLDPIEEGSSLAKPQNPSPAQQRPAQQRPAQAREPDDSDLVPIHGQALLQIQALAAEKRSRTPAQNKLASQLLVTAKLRRSDPAVAALTSLPPRLPLRSNGMVRVDIKTSVDNTVLARINTLGGQVLSSVPRFDAVQADLPIDDVEKLAELPQVRWILPALGALTNKDNTSEGDVTHKANVARSASDLDGSGVTVGVLSDGVDTLAARQASGDLPISPQLTVLPGQAGAGDEGTAMMEIVHDLAPGASLIFASAFSSSAQFAQNILDLRAAGCDIIVDDVQYLAEAVYQDDIVADAVNIVTADGALYFSAAGNDGNVSQGTASNYEGDYAAIAVPETLAGEVVSVHDFGGGAPSNLITVDPPTWITLQWSDPFGGSGNDYDLFLLNNSMSTVLDASTSAQAGAGVPLEAIDSGLYNDLTGRLVVGLWAGSPRTVRLTTHRGRLAAQTDGEVWGHAAAVNAFAVAAVNVASASGGFFTGGVANPVEFFSSDGPRHIFFDATGAPLTPGMFLLSNGGIQRAKPDLAAADGIATATPGFNPFFGTSAAAPHAAAMAALLLQKRPELAALGSVAATTQFRALVGTSTLDNEGSGPDFNSGSGILMADSLLEVAPAAVPLLPRPYWSWFTIAMAGLGLIALRKQRG